MSEQAPTTLKIAAVVIGLSLGHASLYSLRWFLDMGIHSKNLVITFWISVMAILLLFYWLKKKPKIIIPAGIISLLVILPTAPSCLAWTIWLIYGFAP